MAGGPGGKQGGRQIRANDDLQLLCEILENHPTTKLKVLEVIRKSLGKKVDDDVRAALDKKQKG